MQKSVKLGAKYDAESTSGQGKYDTKKTDSQGHIRAGKWSSSGKWEWR
jgi:hypothetical protein